MPYSVPVAQQITTTRIPWPPLLLLKGLKVQNEGETTASANALRTRFSGYSPSICVPIYLRGQPTDEAVLGFEREPLREAYEQAKRLKDNCDSGSGIGVGEVRWVTEEDWNKWKATLEQRHKGNTFWAHGLFRWAERTTAKKIEWVNKAEQEEKNEREKRLQDEERVRTYQAQVVISENRQKLLDALHEEQNKLELELRKERESNQRKEAELDDLQLQKILAEKKALRLEGELKKKQESLKETEEISNTLTSEFVKIKKQLLAIERTKETLTIEQTQEKKKLDEKFREHEQKIAELAEEKKKLEVDIKDQEEEAIATGSYVGKMMSENRELKEALDMLERTLKKGGDTGLLDQIEEHPYFKHKAFGELELQSLKFLGDTKALYLNSLLQEGFFANEQSETTEEEYQKAQRSGEMPPFVALHVFKKDPSDPERWIIREKDELVKPKQNPHLPHHVQQRNTGFYRRADFVVWVRENYKKRQAELFLEHLRVKFTEFDSMSGAYKIPMVFWDTRADKAMTYAQKMKFALSSAGLHAEE